MARADHPPIPFKVPLSQMWPGGSLKMASAGSQSLHQSTYSSCSRSFIFNPQKQQDEPASAPASTQMKRPSHSCQTVQKLVLSRCAFHRKEPAVLRSRRAIVHGYQTHMFSMEAFAVSCSRVADTKSTTGACRLMLASSTRRFA